MKRLLLVGAATVALIGLGASWSWVRAGAAKSVKFNVKDLAGHGLTIIGPTSNDFDKHIAKLKAGKRQKQQTRIDLLRPFSGFIHNAGKADVVAYTVKWELTTNDGRVRTSYSSYSAPGSMMGEKLPPGKDSEIFSGRKIRQNSARIISWDPSLEDDGAPVAGFGGPVDSAQLNVFNDALQRGDDLALTQALAEQLNQASNITMTLDAALFEDGTFVGPDTGGLFVRTRAELSAKHDLIKSITLALRKKATPTQILDHVQAVNNDPQASETSLEPGATRAQAYRYYATIYRTELLNMRSSIGDDKQTLTYALLPTLQRWPKLAKLP